MQGILFASFGTSHDNAREKQIDAVARYLEGAFPGVPLAQSYTSGMVCAILAGRGVHVPGTLEALDGLLARGVRDVAIQPGHLLPGDEYEKLCGLAESRRGSFRSMRIGRPLLASTGDLRRVADIVSRHLPPVQGEAWVLMGHGTPHFSNLAYAALDYHLKEGGREDVYVGAVEGYPGLDVVLRQVQKKPYQKVRLAPLMQVAGDHAQNDMAGSGPDSWASRFAAAGYAVDCRLVGLGELEEIREMYLDHLREAQQGG